MQSGLDQHKLASGQIEIVVGTPMMVREIRCDDNYCILYCNDRNMELNVASKFIDKLVEYTPSLLKVIDDVRHVEVPEYVLDLLQSIYNLDDDLQAALDYLVIDYGISIEGDAEQVSKSICEFLYDNTPLYQRQALVNAFYPEVILESFNIYSKQHLLGYELIRGRSHIDELEIVIYKSLEYPLCCKRDHINFDSTVIKKCCLFKNLSINPSKLHANILLRLHKIADEVRHGLNNVGILKYLNQVMPESDAQLIIDRGVLCLRVILLDSYRQLDISNINRVARLIAESMLYNSVD